MISVQTSLSSSGLKPPISIRNDVIPNTGMPYTEMSSVSLGEILNFEGAGVDRVLRSFGWSDEDIRNLRATEPILWNPHRNHLFWHKGQTHCHSKEEDVDGDTPAYNLETAYSEKGYTFICLTNHNQSYPDPKKNGEPYILHITSVEDGNRCRHHLGILGVNFDELDPEKDGNMNGMFDCDSCDCDNIPKRVDYVTQVQKTIAVAHHPTSGHNSNFTHIECDEGWGRDELINHNLTGIEFFNAAGELWSNEWWDHALAKHALRWGFAADDHEKHLNAEKRRRDFNRGWVNVNSGLLAAKFLKSLENLDNNENELKTDILENIKRGNFIAVVRSPDQTASDDLYGITTAGPIVRIATAHDLIIVEANQNSTFQFRVMTQAMAAQEEPASVPREPDHFDETHAVYRLRGDEAFVRVEVDQDYDRQTYRAYSQPIAMLYWFPTLH